MTPQAEKNIKLIKYKNKTINQEKKTFGVKLLK